MSGINAWIPVQNYKSTHAAVISCATRVNTRTDRYTELVSVQVQVLVQHCFSSASEHFLDRTHFMYSICSAVFIINGLTTSDVFGKVTPAESIYLLLQNSRQTYAADYHDHAAQTDAPLSAQ